MAHRICLLSSEARARSQWPAHAYAGPFVCPSGRGHLVVRTSSTGRVRTPRLGQNKISLCVWLAFIGMLVADAAARARSSSSSQIDLDVNEAFSFSLSHTCKAKNQEAQTQR